MFKWETQNSQGVPILPPTPGKGRGSRKSTTVKQYGLKNKRELWKAKSIMRT